MFLAYPSLAQYSHALRTLCDRSLHSRWTTAVPLEASFQSERLVSICQTIRWQKALRARARDGESRAPWLSNCPIECHSPLSKLSAFPNSALAGISLSASQRQSTRNVQNISPDGISCNPAMHNSSRPRSTMPTQMLWGSGTLASSVKQACPIAVR